MLASLYIDLLISAIEYKGHTLHLSLSSWVPRYVIADAADMATTAAAAAIAAAAVELTAIETDRNNTCLDHDVTRQCLVEIVTAKMPFSWTEIGLPTYCSIEAPMKVLGGVRGLNVYGMDNVGIHIDKRC